MSNPSQLKQLLSSLSIPLNDEFDIALLTANDLPDICKMLDDPEVSKYLFFAPSPHEVYQGYFQPIIEEIEKAKSENRLPNTVNLIIRHKDTNQFCGEIGLAPIDFHPGNYEIGYQIPTHAWGKGLATLGCQFMTLIAFDDLEAHKVTADCYAGNMGSARVLEKSGYIREGCSKGYYQDANRSDDKLYFGMTKAQFDKMQS